MIEIERESSPALLLWGRRKVLIEKFSLSFPFQKDERF
jgi:hypothetical protein